MHEHLYNHDEVVLKCDQCKMGFMQKEGYERHKLRDKWRQQKGEYRKHCLKCNTGTL